MITHALPQIDGMRAKEHQLSKGSKRNSFLAWVIISWETDTSQ